MYKCFNVFQTIVNMRHFTLGFLRKLWTSCNSIATSRILCWSMKEQELLKNSFQVHLISCQFLVATKAKCPKTERQRPNHFYHFPRKAHCIMLFSTPLALRRSGLIGAMLTTPCALSFFTIKQDATDMGHGIC